MKTDEQMHRAILEEIQMDQSLEGVNVNITVENGFVMLSGNVDSYQKKMGLEKAVIRVLGIRGVDNDLDVHISEDSVRSDADIQRSVASIIKWNSSIDESTISNIKVVVKNGWVTLEGEVDWDYQRSKARSLAEDITGVKGVTDNILVISRSPQFKANKSRLNDTFKDNFLKRQ